MEVEWKSVVGYGEYGKYYEVSSCGQVRSVDRIINNARGYKSRLKGQMISLCPDGRGYVTMILWNHGKRKQVNVHRLVALAFIENPDNRDQVNHINGDPKDNRVENLEWCTGSENMLHAFRSGIWSPASGDNHYKRKGVKANED